MPKKKQPETAGPTSYDVASLAGVSQSAVSRAFSKFGSVAPTTRAKIMRAAKQLGYQPNAFARGLITKKSNLIAVIISNLTNLNYPEVLAELTQRLSAEGNRVLLFSLAAESDVDDVLEQVWPYRVDGAIVAARLHDDQIQQFNDRGIPVILYNRVGDVAPSASVCCDSAAGERELVRLLMAGGHRTFGIIAGPEDSYVGEERLEAARRALNQSGIEPFFFRGRFDYASGAEGFHALMDQAGGRLDAVICTNDAMAIGAIDCAKSTYGFRLPDDISIVGFDGVGPATWASYQLTTIRQPVRRMTAAVVAMLLERIANPGMAPEQRLFGGELLLGRSARLG
ncbi:MAG: LacI family DNA-binding transcriptional regulator [Phenylobacterium sp.]|uniref:LacI family DNA-binding transcriptional regulator n=1 Tax=Phenylobacterium sp. TaxID=1871053 RepID=UPI0025CC093F|nr:LacI family DNA-binding transcriptional regulator [Phenylobacterium sp.]MCA3458604.1 LacI family DNA-binding transcriptional regulator [Rhodobacter sp.]MCA6247222.1 LacI family DNA-binding transcriptional regulator [Phenylobacterium sp.]MCA6254379.1 LacI family DNA-binding transcriptional regulator [Phenylobacterium sp.]MCA6277989.1 LacI family DNA-binding transcriptional regulator [Phenylobacterium sp.]MCA6292863.1 LacI family DNA-binding transcriptional regulator [Phenylobacterium sp.]